ncbi:hypothetical protein FVE85_1316 [Porphyridium purpureum]|uniref:Uncharacterized protein n=1 Tax=Porphyridium purpureum TaxID=35688 RepID=A0A5J4YHH1_PORPP|nr:hypothetical protein FVE85_1316 [Porphyridium purpureum]|eukprot:POR2217..scf251_18
MVIDLNITVNTASLIWTLVLDYLCIFLYQRAYKSNQSYVHYLSRKNADASEVSVHENEVLGFIGDETYLRVRGKIYWPDALLVGSTILMFGISVGMSYGLGSAQKFQLVERDVGLAKGNPASAAELGVAIGDVGNDGTFWNTGEVINFAHLCYSRPDVQWDINEYIIAVLEKVTMSLTDDTFAELDYSNRTLSVLGMRQNCHRLPVCGNCQDTACAILDLEFMTNLTRDCGMASVLPLKDPISIQIPEWEELATTEMVWSGDAVMYDFGSTPHSVPGTLMNDFGIEFYDGTLWHILTDDEGQRATIYEISKGDDIAVAAISTSQPISIFVDSIRNIGRFTFSAVTGCTSTYETVLDASQGLDATVCLVDLEDCRQNPAARCGDPDAQTVFLCCYVQDDQPSMYALVTRSGADEFGSRRYTFYAVYSPLDIVNDFAADDVQSLFDALLRLEFTACRSNAAESGNYMDLTDMKIYILENSISITDITCFESLTPRSAPSINIGALVGSKMFIGDDYFAYNYKTIPRSAPIYNHELLRELITRTLYKAIGGAAGFEVPVQISDGFDLVHDWYRTLTRQVNITNAAIARAAVSKNLSAVAGVSDVYFRAGDYEVYETLGVTATLQVWALVLVIVKVTMVLAFALCAFMTRKRRAYPDITKPESMHQYMVKQDRDIRDRELQTSRRFASGRNNSYGQIKFPNGDEAVELENSDTEGVTAGAILSPGSSDAPHSPTPTSPRWLKFRRPESDDHQLQDCGRVGGGGSGA